MNSLKGCQSFLQTLTSIMTAYFNIHIVSPNDGTSKEHIALFDTFDLLQHGAGPTQVQRHALNLLIRKHLSAPAASVKALSDHFCVSFDGLVVPIIQTRSKSDKKKGSKN